jgi:hypothetical protein
MHGYAAPKLDTVRMGFIGLGDRGWGNVNRFASIEGVDVKAFVMLYPTVSILLLNFCKLTFHIIIRMHIQTDPKPGSNYASGTIST